MNKFSSPRIFIEVLCAAIAFVKIYQIPMDSCLTVLPNKGFHCEDPDKRMEFRHAETVLTLYFGWSRSTI